MIAARQIFLGRGGAKLPYDAEVEYLESTGTQWIDTGVSISDASLADVTWNVEVVNYNDGCMGAFGSGSYVSMYFNLYANKFYMRNMRTSGGSFTGVSGFNTVRFSGGNSYLNGTAVETEIPLNTNPVHTMYLFAYNRNGTTTGFCKARVSSFIVKKNGVTVCDFIPVRVGSEGAMYDRVSKQLFRNQGTGVFGYGNDVVEVEYLESTGTQYIDTGRPIPTDFWFDATIDIAGTDNTYKTLLGARIASGNHDYQFSFQGANNNFLARYGTSNSQYFASRQTGMTRIRVDSGGKLYINESFVIQLGVDSPPEILNMYIFWLNNNGVGSQAAKYIRVYSLKFGGTNESHDLIPVRVGMEGAMKDTLTRRFYHNAGTGNFSYGADKAS